MAHRTTMPASLHYRRSSSPPPLPSVTGRERSQRGATMSLTKTNFGLTAAGSLPSMVDPQLRKLLGAPYALTILMTISLLTTGYLQADRHGNNRSTTSSYVFHPMGDAAPSWLERAAAAHLQPVLVTLQPLSQTQQQTLLQSQSSLPLRSVTPQNQQYLQQHCPEAQTRYQELERIVQKQTPMVGNVAAALQEELLKYCAMRTVLQDNDNAVETPVAVAIDVTVDAPEWLVDVGDWLDRRFAGNPPYSLAVRSDPRYWGPTVHAGSLLILHAAQTSVAEGMLQILRQTPLTSLLEHPVLVSTELHRLATNSGVRLLPQVCHFGTGATPHGTYTCPDETFPYCCSVMDPELQQVILLQRHPMDFYRPVPSSQKTTALTQPFHGDALRHTKVSPVNQLEPEDLAVVATVRAEALPRPTRGRRTPPKSLYDTLLESDRLPNAACLQCMHLKKCPVEDMIHKCSDYFATLCSTTVAPLPVTKQVMVHLPLARHDPTRLVPRIVHQTWYETLTRKDYPNMSRLQESFRQSGWEYRFYSDEDAVEFLKIHFPPEVLEAYNALLPGAFKADLFRYCALLIHGGVYADVDILLESNLDLAVAPDIGFMVPMDQPDACVWQGLIAAAPGHAFLAQAIETVVNQVRNRYTSIDLDASFCEPEPRLAERINFKVLHMFDVLFTAGPCLLGASMNRVLGRHGQNVWEPGDVQEVPTSKEHYVPGRTVILKQNKWDMAGHRFTIVDENLIVAATDLENSDDRANARLIAEEQAAAAAKANEDQKSSDTDDDDEEEERKLEDNEENGGEKDQEGDRTGGEEEKEDDKSKDEKETNDDASDGEDENDEDNDDGNVQGEADKDESLLQDSKQVEEKKDTAPAKQIGEHYSKAHAKTGIYGLNGLYVDLTRANEEIRIVIQRSTF